MPCYSTITVSVDISTMRDAKIRDLAILDASKKYPVYKSGKRLIIDGNYRTVTQAMEMKTAIENYVKQRYSRRIVEKQAARQGLRVIQDKRDPNKVYLTAS